MTAPGTLFGIGVGPGDPELLTRKAERIIRAVPAVAVPVAVPGGDCYALAIVRDLLRPEQAVIELHFPMSSDRAVRVAHRRRAAEALAAHLHMGRDMAFLTEGDPLLHSTFGYLLHYLPTGIPVEIVPGVSSPLAAAAALSEPLVNEDRRLAILPAAFEDVDRLRAALRDFDTVVLLKVSRVLDQLIDLLDELGLRERAALVERASHPDQRVARDLGALRGTPVHYLSLVIVHGGRAHDAD